MRRHPARLAPIAALALGVVVAGLGGCTDEGNKDGFCDQLAQIPPLGQVLGGLDTTDPGATEADLDDTLVQFRALETSAPGEIRDDIARVRQGVELVLEAVKDNPDDLPAAREAIQQQADQLPGLASAAEAVVSYADTECDLELS